MFHSHIHAFKSSNHDLLFEVETGRMVNVNPTLLQVMSEAAVAGDTQRAEMLAFLAGISPVNKLRAVPPKTAILQSLSLAIAQKCNLGCTYCYAEQGTFGKEQNNMSLEVAKSSVDRLLQDTPPDKHITFAFMGGEPLMNRQVLRATTEYAVEKAKVSMHTISFTITTNATLIRPDDADFFQRYAFTVTVSIDGTAKVNDMLRPYISGKGTSEHIKEKVSVLFAIPHRTFQVLARVTITPKNLNLPETFQYLLDMGFDSVQFSPLVKSPSGKEEMSADDFDIMLEQLISCGEMFRKAFLQQKLLPLQNVLSSLNRIHDYKREVYPCGAGAGYMGVSAEGNLYACHRFINDEDRYMGNIEAGVDAEIQSQWLTDRHLDSQGACNTCWARYMCSGGCHHEVINRGRPACDYIRGWLHYCLGLYTDLVEADSTALEYLLGNSEGLVNVLEEEDGTGLHY